MPDSNTSRSQNPPGRRPLAGQSAQTVLGRNGRHIAWRQGGLLVVIVVAVALLLWTTGQWARERALRDLSVQAQAGAQLSLAALGHKLAKFQAIPQVLAQDTALIATLQAPSPSPSPAAQDRLSQRLAVLAGGLGAAALYVMQADGETVAASNWRQPDSFVGHDYRFRPYYRDALAFGEAAHFALGTVSREPGLYLSKRVDGPGGPLGVWWCLKWAFRIWKPPGRVAAYRSS